VDADKARIKVAVIIVSYNTRDLLMTCLSSVAASGAAIESEIVVIDNGSVDGSVSAVRARFSAVTVIDNAENLGFGAACNQGIKCTSAPLVLLLNSDAILSITAFTELVHVMDSVPRCAAAGCAVLLSDGAAAVNTRNFLTPLNQAAESLGASSVFAIRALERSYRPRLGSGSRDCALDWIDGACLMLRRSALDEIGLFDERFFMYSEDEDLCYRLRERGWKVCYSARASVIHRGGASSRQERALNLRRFYESQILFLQKHRGAKAVRWYIIGMRTVLALKQGWYSLSLTPDRKAEMHERSLALTAAVASRKHTGALTAHRSI